MDLSGPVVTSEPVDSPGGLVPVEPVPKQTVRNGQQTDVLAVWKQSKAQHLFHWDKRQNKGGGGSDRMNWLKWDSESAGSAGGWWDRDWIVFFSLLLHSFISSGATGKKKKTSGGQTRVSPGRLRVSSLSLSLLRLQIADPGTALMHQLPHHTLTNPLSASVRLPTDEACQVPPRECAPVCVHFDGSVGCNVSNGR